MKKLIMILAIMAVASFANAQLILTGVYDGPLTGGTPKGVELFACVDIPDLSVYGLGSANNGLGSDGEEFTFPADAVTGGTFIYVASEDVGFQNWFGFAPDYTTLAMSINGDDAIELFVLGNVFDIYGDINVDGNGEPWEYEDGWAKRNTQTGPDGSTFVLGNWTYSGPGALDNETDNDSAVNGFPLYGYECDQAIPTEDSNWGAVKSLYR